MRANPARPPQYPAGLDETQVGAGLLAARRVVFFTARIVAAWQRRFACFNLNMEPGEGPLVEQHENACRMQDDSWLEAVYEDRISGWNDDF